jgi:hypothetical protein
MNDLTTLPGAGGLAGRAKPFWDRPEGKTGLIFGIPLLGLLGWGLYKILPYVIVLFQNAITALFFGLILAGLIYVVLDKRVHTLVWYAYKMVMRKITGFVVELDPISILRSYLDHLKEQRRIMRQQISNLRGQMKSLERTIAENRDLRQTSLKTVQKAQEEGMRKAAVLHARKAGRLGKSNLTLQALYDKLEMLYRVLNKMDETASFMLEDMEDEINVKERERKAILAGHSAFKAAMNILRGDPDKRALFDQALDFMAEDFAMRVGEIEDFIDTAGGFIESVDLQNLVFEEEALAELEAWEQRTDSLLMGPGEKQLLLEAARDPQQVLHVSSAGDTDRDAIPASIRGTRTTPPPYQRFFESD